MDCLDDFRRLLRDECVAVGAEFQPHHPGRGGSVTMAAMTSVRGMADGEIRKCAEEMTTSW